MTVPAGYDFMACMVFESRDEGLLAVPPAGGLDDETEIVRWSSPAAFRIVRWAVASRGGPPQAPAALSLSGGYVLFSTEIGAGFPVPTAAGSTLWALTGEYTYAMRKARDVDSQLPLGYLPGLDHLQGVTVNGIPASQWLRTLIDNRPVPGMSTPPSADLQNIIHG